MVGAAEHAQLNSLESQVDNGGGGAWEYLCLLRKLKVRRSEKVLKHGLPILSDPNKRSKLGAEGEYLFLFKFFCVFPPEIERLEIGFEMASEYITKS